MTDNIELFDGATILDIPVDRVLQAALDKPLKTAIVLGETEDGEFYFASSLGDSRHVLWVLELAKKELLDMD